MTQYGGPNGIAWMCDKIKGFKQMYDMVQQTKKDEAEYKAGNIQPRKGETNA